ncbi:MAG TPA: hypothetical protein VMS45_04765 [Gemmatimonadaceae bacterium]|nr:hypothetical protein [Gemmatimonadaceae bacterium]
MKRIDAVVIAMLAMLMLASVASASVATPNVERREWRQDQRIRQGVKSGELTRPEARRLVRGEARIDRMEWRAKRDGHVSPRERAHLQRALNHESRRIYRLKHNGRTA